ncbi:MAG TPA: hypothetical protein VFH06_00210 [Candidatus Saccharimonadales bacterium]|nr:hypothetical protein [Candidatus Saccharimonadales bacterium]
MSELSDRAKLLDEAANLNLTHVQDTARWFNNIAEYWLKTGIKIDPTQVRHHIFSEMRELWKTNRPVLVPPATRNSREYDCWVRSWVVYFLRDDDADRNNIILVLGELREWLSLPRLDVQ